MTLLANAQNRMLILQKETIKNIHLNSVDSIVFFSSEHEGTKEDPFSVSETINIAQVIGERDSLIIYVRGFVTNIQEVSLEKGDATIVISDDSIGSTNLLVEKCRYLQKEPFTDVEQIHENDIVVICGKLSYYTKTETLKLNDCYLFSINCNSQTSNEDNIDDNIISIENKDSIVSPIILNICSFNTGDWSGHNYVPGSDEIRDEYRKILVETKANIIGLQEDERYFGEEQEPKTAIYGMYRHYYRTGNSQHMYLAFASDYHITNIREISYVYAPCEKTQKRTFDHKKFIAGDLSIDNKMILVISFHFDWSDKYLRAQQAEQVRAYAKQYDYAIVIGDTNPNDYINREYQGGGNLSDEEWGLWTDNGFTMANKGYFGVFPTMYKGGIIDNIFVLGGTIKEVFTISKDWQRDHKPLCAKVVF